MRNTGRATAAALAVSTALLMAASGRPRPAAAQINLLPPTLAFAAAESGAHRRHACQRETLGASRDCAMTKCRTSGERDCRIVAACDRSQWAGSIAISLPGTRVTLTICGVPSRPGLIARLKDICRTYRARGLQGCTLDLVWTPAGEEEFAGLHWSRERLGRGRTSAQ